MNVALALLNPPHYYPTRGGKRLLRVASNTIVGIAGDFGELRYAIKDRDGKPWPLSQLRLAVLDALLYGDGFLTETGEHVDRQDVNIRKPEVPA